MTRNMVMAAAFMLITSFILPSQSAGRGYYFCREKSPFHSENRVRVPLGRAKKIDVLGRGSSRLSNIWPNIGVELCGFSRDEMAALRMLFQKASGAPVIIRLIKAMVCLAVALFGLLVAADNVIDYSTNFQFV